MKRLSIIMLALAFAIVSAGSAMAFHEGDEGTAEGAFGISGSYTIDAEALDRNDGAEVDYYDDDMEVVLRINTNNVTGVVDLEINDSTFQGNGNNFGVDNYWVEWGAMDNLKVKIGEYGLSFGSKVVVYADPPARHIGLTYAMDAADIGFYLGKVSEGDADDPDDDNDSMSLLVNVKSVEFFKTLDFIYITNTDENGGSSVTDTYIGFDSAFMAGPVAVDFEYGAISGDSSLDGGNFMLAQIGLDDVVGFDFNIDYFSSNEDFATAEWGDGDYYPYMLFGWLDEGPVDLSPAAGTQDPGDWQVETTMIGLSGSYKINDKATVIAKALIQAEVADLAVGTEVDLHLKYKFDDQVTGTFTYATLMPDDEYYGADDDSASVMRARFSMKF